MQKPHGMSRKDARNMKAIVRQFLGNDSVPSDSIHVEFQSEENHTWAVGFQGGRTEEGFSSTLIEVTLGEKPGTYSVLVDNRSRDCDGRIDRSSRCTVGAAGKRKRFYFSRNWQKNRPTGKFGIKGPFKILSFDDSRQRDYTAEAAGY